MLPVFLNIAQKIRFKIKEKNVFHFWHTFQREKSYTKRSRDLEWVVDILQAFKVLIFFTVSIHLVDIAVRALECFSWAGVSAFDCD